MVNMTIDEVHLSVGEPVSLASPLVSAPPLSAAGTGHELARTGISTWTFWLGYLSFGGTMSFTTTTEALAGRVLVSASELYLMEQARIS